jgi:hypothetical protein
MSEIRQKRAQDHYANTPALKLLKEMFHKIVEKHYSYRESWEILIEVLAQHLGILKQPWLYSDPKCDIEEYEDKLNPLRRSAFFVQFPQYDPLQELLGLPPKLTKPVIQQLDPHHPHYTFYFDKNIKTRLKQYRVRYSSRQSEAAKDFVKQFSYNGMLEAYVTRARTERQDGGSSSILPRKPPTEAQATSAQASTILAPYSKSFNLQDAKTGSDKC